MNLHELNSASAQQAADFFEFCCCAPRWIDAMVAARPYASAQSLLTQGEATWLQMQEPDWLAAFAGHPRIGDVESLDKRFANTRSTAAHEQQGAAAADRQVLEDLLQCNQQYFERFGFIFIVFASGKSALQMLELLRGRLPNERTAELCIAAAEQWKITQLRLHKTLEA